MNVENKKTHFGGIPRHPLRFVLYVTKGYWKWGATAFIAVTLATLLGASGPYLYAKIIDSANLGEVNTVIFWIAVTITASALSLAFWRLSGFMGMRFQLNVERTAHLKLFSYLINHSQTYFNNRFAGSLGSKVSNGADGAEHLLESTLWNYYGIFLNLIITTIYLVHVSKEMSIFFVCSVAFIFGINYVLVRKLLPLVVQYNNSTSIFRGAIIDTLTNISAVKAYVRSKTEEFRLKQRADKRFEDNIKEWRFSEFILVLNNITVIAIEIVLFVGAAYLWSQGLISVGVLIMLVAVFMSIQGDLIFIGNNMRSFIRVYGMIEEGLSEILVTQDLVDTKNAKKLVTKKGGIVWDSVTFRYEEGVVFKDFNLTIEPGQKVGLVGHSGAGKTTFVSLLSRQHDLDTGSIKIDDQDIREVTQESLREAMAIVPQEPILFHRSIKENIAYGKPKARDGEIISVAKKAEAHTFIATLPSGYDTLVGERGVKLSGGQKQRVAIARAMLKNAPILILDEATSALDSESEVAIQKALHELMEGKTVIAVAHRLSTLREMDRIIVLEGGVIVEDGSHTELVKKGGMYARLWKHQAGGFLND